jgi:hypothetical protein
MQIGFVLSAKIRSKYDAVPPGVPRQLIAGSASITVHCVRLGESSQ